MIAPIDQQECKELAAGENPYIVLTDVAKAVLALPGSEYWEEDWYKNR